MLKEDRFESLRKGFIPIRAKLTRSGWAVAGMTANGGWVAFVWVGVLGHEGREKAIKRCKELVAEFPERYVEDNE